MAEALWPYARVGEGYFEYKLVLQCRRGMWWRGVVCVLCGWRGYFVPLGKEMVPGQAAGCELLLLGDWHVSIFESGLKP